MRWPYIVMPMPWSRGIHRIVNDLPSCSKLANGLRCGHFSSARGLVAEESFLVSSWKMQVPRQYANRTSIRTLNRCIKSICWRSVRSILLDLLVCTMCISVLLCAWICFVDENETIKIKIHDIYDFALAFILEYFGHGRLTSYSFLSSLLAPVVKILGNVNSCYLCQILHNEA